MKKYLVIFLFLPILCFSQTIGGAGSSNKIIIENPKIITGAGANKVLTSDGDGNLTLQSDIQIFSITIDSTSIGTSEKITFFYTPVAITIDSLVMVGEGTTSVTPDIHFGTDRSAAGTAIISSPSAVTLVTTGDRIISFDNGTITANSFVWIEFDAVTTCPNELSITLCGRK